MRKMTFFDKNKDCLSELSITLIKKRRRRKKNSNFSSDTTLTHQTIHPSSFEGIRKTRLIYPNLNPRISGGVRMQITAFKSCREQRNRWKVFITHRRREEAAYGAYSFEENLLLASCIRPLVPWIPPMRHNLRGIFKVVFERGKPRERERGRGGDRTAIRQTDKL